MQVEKIDPSKVLQITQYHVKNCLLESALLICSKTILLLLRIPGSVQKLTIEKG